MEDMILNLIAKGGPGAIIAAAFLLLLWMLWRADKRNQAYCDRMQATEFDRSELLKALAALNQTLTDLRIHCTERWAEHMRSTRK